MQFLYNLTKVIILLVSMSIVNIIPFAQAKTTLSIAEEFNILAVNGEAAKQFFFGQNRRLELKSGLNRIVLQFEAVYEGDTEDDFDIVRSSPYLLQVYLNKDTSYMQSLVKPGDAISARKFIKNPLFRIRRLNSKKTDVSSDIVNISDKDIPFNFSLLQSDKQDYLVASTKLRPNASIDLSYSKDDASKLSSLQPISGPESESAPPTSKVSNSKSRALDMLVYWWAQASAEEKEAFLNSIKKQ
ncbi:DUF2057 family protein [Aliikangiella sp. G2MR2-5]|uniref:DUF2057 family protein n=1 Tax=Aliikangiella sp. G2MR2-5 TaxID=2788943 RepID=UPI0018ABC088|nr:DUF2057 family protein [Aliikangiella sp. G2MR2-5]